MAGMSLNSPGILLVVRGNGMCRPHCTRMLLHVFKLVGCGLFVYDQVICVGCTDGVETV